MFKKLLVPLDGSPTGQAALLTAIDMAKCFGASLVVVSAYDAFPFLVAGPDYGYSQVQYVDALREETSNIVKAGKEQAEAAGLVVEDFIVEASKTWRAILDTAQSSQADLIVIGTHGRSGLDKLVMGSVTQRVLQNTALPVMVVRGGA